ncbi:HAD hydrolase-like protein [uncultured Gimesia sp.]|uniref:HAD family hydrolase n=1 Tax=uncultured Gimesia sp. TaxID=1678688 RepID=UPI0030DB67AA|tara:strand:- start:239483 stop:240124 length:642 start_codon:yes stop_codon:yes gene_type:complete
MKLECKTLILDLDGTISDSSSGIINCINHALKTHGLPTAYDDLIKQEIGPPLNETFLNLSPGITPSEVSKLVSTYRERYSEIGYSENLLYPGIPSVLDQLRHAKITLGVCTAKRKDFAEKILSLFGLLEYFAFVDGGDIGVTKGSQLAGLMKSKIIDEQAIMVGDRATDITSAQENGLRSIGVLWGFGDYEELSQASPACILEKVDELPGIVI